MKSVKTIKYLDDHDQQITETNSWQKIGLSGGIYTVEIDGEKSADFQESDKYSLEEVLFGGGLLGSNPIKTKHSHVYDRSYVMAKLADFDYKDHSSVQLVAKFYAQAIHTTQVNELRGVTDQWFLEKIKEELLAIDTYEEE